MCLSVSEDISGTTRAIFTKFLCMLTTAVARSSGRVTKSQGRGQFWGFSSPLTVHCISSAEKWGWACTPRAKSDIYDCFVVYVTECHSLTQPWTVHGILRPRLPLFIVSSRFALLLVNMHEYIGSNVYCFLMVVHLLPSIGNIIF